MGMFDWVKIDESIPLPIPPQFLEDLPNFEFQTKSLQKTLNTYFLKKEGLFLVDEFGRLIDSNFHGVLDFGAYHSTDLIDYLFDFKAKYTDGLLVDLKLTRFEEHFHESKKEKLKKLKDKQNQCLKCNVIYRVQKAFIYFLGISSYVSSKGLGYLVYKDYSIIFYCPKIVIFSKDTNFLDFGFYLSNIDTGFKLTNSFYEKSFTFRFFGFGIYFAFHKKLRSL